VVLDETRTSHVHSKVRGWIESVSADFVGKRVRRGAPLCSIYSQEVYAAELEFLSVLPREEARGMIGEAAEILRALGDRLAERGSRYAAVFAALLAAGGEAGLTRPLAARPTPGEESSPAAIDKAWMDEPVTFGGPQPVKFYGKGARP